MESNLSRSLFSSLTIDQKRSFETRIIELEEEIDELQSDADLSNEKFKKINADLKKVNDDLVKERNEVQQLNVRISTCYPCPLRLK